MTQNRLQLIMMKYSVCRLALGCLSPRTIFWQLKDYERQRTSNKSTYWVVFELLWRDYFKLVALKFGNRIFFRDGIFSKTVSWKQDMNAFNAWKGE